jgi:biotin carboxyl carrier protein
MEENNNNIENFRIGDTIYRTRLTKMYKERKPYVTPDPRNLYSVIPGTIAEILVKSGKKVKEGEVLLLLEAMKMKNRVLAPFDAKVKVIHVKEGQIVPKNFLIIELEMI